MKLKALQHKIFLWLLFLIIPFSSAFNQITPPEEYLGSKPGADFFLMNFEQAIGYFELLASQTDRMQIFDMGATSEGRRMKYGVISSAQNLAELDRYKEINQQLTMAKDLSKEDAEKLADQGKVIVWVDGGLHASEVAPAQHLAQLVYDLVTEDNRRSRIIRENVITVVVFANPDGMTMVSDWYKQNVGTPYEVSSMPWLYHKYAGHDNNRDAFMANLIETQNMNIATAKEWMPEILYNHHQTSPFPARIWIPPDSEPTNPNVHPILVRWKNLIGSAMGKAFEEANQPGAISRLSFDTWYPGYATQVVDARNTVSILTETGLYRYATPHHYTLNDFPESQKDMVMGVFYPNPWPGGWWRLGDAVDYCLTASKSVLEVAAKYRYEFLLNKYVMGSDVIKKFNSEPPYGWIIPPDQQDSHSTTIMLNRLLINGIDIYKADESFVYAGISFPKETYVIPAGQPYGLWVKNMFEKQNYPDLRKYPHLWQGIVGRAKLGKAPLRAYDGVGWTLPIQMGIKYHELSRPVDLKSTQITSAITSSGTVSGGGSYVVFSHSDNGSFVAVNKILEAGGKVHIAQEKFSLTGTKYPKGTFVVTGNSVKANILVDIAKNSGLAMKKGKVQVKLKPVSKPRIALYRSWTANMDAGWISWLLEQYDFPFHFLTNAEVKAGSLNDRFDVIVLADQRAASIINGHRKGTIPPDYVGGITMDGVENLKEFILNGGTLVCNKSSSLLPIEHFKFPIRNVLAKVKSDSFNCPGSILKMSYNTDHPLAFGMQKKGIAFFSRGLVFEVIKDTVKTKDSKQKPAAKGGDKTAAEDDKKPAGPAKKPVKKEKPVNYAKVTPEIVAHYPDDPLLVSGWMIGEDFIREKAAIMNVPFGKGNVVLFGFNVHNRAQTYSTFKLLFNALYN